jgi:hypothetical protein
MTLSTLNLDLFNQLRNSLTVRDITALACVCKGLETMVDKIEETFWQARANQIVSEYPPGFTVTWKAWALSPGTIKYSDGNELDFKNSQMYVRKAWSMSDFYSLCRLLPGPLICKEVGSNGIENIHFRNSTTSEMVLVVRYVDGKKFILAKESWDSFEQFEKDPSVRQWQLFWK